jgi:predicted DNA repair protein MutK
LVPAALAISALAPWAITPLLMFGGTFLCFEGVEKLAHKFLHGEAEESAHQAQLMAAVADEQVDLVAFERDKIKGAVRTDFVLSAEIVTIALGTVATQPFYTQLSVLVGLSLLMTVGVYGLVAGIVKLDDLGLHLMERGGAGKSVGAGLLRSAPYLMKGLSIAGTAAMFLVGGGILTHGIPAAHHLIEELGHAAGALPGVGDVLGAILPMLLDGLFGVVAGALVLLVVMGAKRVLGKK